MGKARARASSIVELAGQFEPADAAELLVRILISRVSALEPSDKDAWQKIVRHALEGGLSKERLAAAFSCNVMTISRWEAGQNVPAPMARKAIRQELIDMLEKQAASFRQRELVPHLEAVRSAAD